MLNKNPASWGGFYPSFHPILQSSLGHGLDELPKRDVLPRDLS